MFSRSMVTLLSEYFRQVAILFALCVIERKKIKLFNIILDNSTSMPKCSALSFVPRRKHIVRTLKC